MLQAVVSSTTPAKSSIQQLSFDDKAMRTLDCPPLESLHGTTGRFDSLYGTTGRKFAVTHHRTRLAHRKDIFPEFFDIAFQRRQNVFAKTRHVRCRPLAPPTAKPPTWARKNPRNVRFNEALQLVGNIRPVGSQNLFYSSTNALVLDMASSCL